MPDYDGVAAEGTPLYHYHYTSAETALDSILRHRTLRFSPLSKTNDPREAELWNISVLAAPGNTPDSEAFLTTVEAFGAAIARDMHLLCLTNEDAMAIADPERYPYAHGWAHARMWAQYGKLHSGVCLVFDPAALDLAVRDAVGSRTLWCGPVTYRDGLADLRTAQLPWEHLVGHDLSAVADRHVHDHHDAFFFTKNRDWSSESEYRFVARGTGPEPIDVHITGSLRGVVTGSMFPPADMARLEDRLKPFSGADPPWVARIRWINGQPVLLPPR